MQTTDLLHFLAKCHYEGAAFSSRSAACKNFLPSKLQVILSRTRALFGRSYCASCMAYVDLNPIRAGIAVSLEESDFTSIQDRIYEIQGQRATDKPKLMSFIESDTGKTRHAFLPYNLKDYLELVDWTGE